VRGRISAVLTAKGVTAMAATSGHHVSRLEFPFLAAFFERDFSD
jgi:hypothetical protein